jgi:uncharacterized protein YlzI (FlbEa/FlbD family)
MFFGSIHVHNHDCCVDLAWIDMTIDRVKAFRRTIVCVARYHGSR